MDAGYVQEVLTYHTLGVLQVKPRMGSYIWLRQEHYRLPSTGRFFLSFEAQARNDIHVSFNKDCSEIEGRDGMSDRAPNYEVVIGGWMNTKTALRKKGQQQVAARKEANPAAAIPSEGWNKYWLVFDNGLIVLGRGESGRGEILRWKDESHEFLNLHYVGFSSWDSPIQYREIKVSPFIPPLSGRKSTAPGEFFFFNNPTFSDLIFEIKNAENENILDEVHAHATSLRLYAHKCILARYSHHMRQLFNPVSPPSSPQIITVTLPHGTKGRDFENLLRALYAGQLGDLKVDFWHRPRTPRSLQGWKELSFSGRNGDECGIFHWIGTNYGRCAWANPHKTKRMVVRCSSPPSRYSWPELLVDRGFHTTWYTSGRPAWIEVELDKGMAAVVRGYTLRQDGSYAYPRSWRLLASNDRLQWDELSTHENDCAIAAPGQWAYWPLSSHTTVPYSVFRLELTGPNASPVTPNIFALSNFELYGFLNEGRPI
jgi:hypothetical protein